MIINSLLDLDQYKATMMQLIYHQYPDVEVEYKFKCRTPEVDLKQHIKEIREEIFNLGKLRFLEDELKYLSSLRYIKDDYVEFLKGFSLKSSNVVVSEISGSKSIDITIKGKWLDTILFETLILSIVNEIYYKKYHTVHNIAKGINKLNYEIDMLKLNNIKTYFADFGTRRRFSGQWHDYVVSRVHSEIPTFIGTSNLLLAKKYNLTPIGTQAHEIFMAHQALGELKDFQINTMNSWIKEYQGDLGVALTDPVGMNAFLGDFNMYYSKLFDGARHDSGDAFTWAKKLIKHYKSLGIDPKSKTAVFSNGLNFIAARELENRFGSYINCRFGIGTYFTNNVLEEKPIQIVIKMTMCNGKPVAKISDDYGKQMCEDKEYLDKLKNIFNFSS